ncbi:protein disulfide isomerase CRELD2 [Pseudophryne corroboree]|uniref:protein disulfide isomerase CRELD2 n=1 Tax=Pseudophryne corroboree TaxID=495146 RepID=UPI003081F81F
MGIRAAAVSFHLATWLLFVLCASSPAAKNSCDTCRQVVDRFHKGLEDTSRKNFGGGNTAWEEKTLSKYETSEIRLVEIIENLCDSSDFACNVMVEEHEEQIEKWWFKMKKNGDLLKWFCIETIEVCCPPGMYGPDCLACLGGSERPCHGNGFCSGDGTRGGDGSCSCHAGYTGPFCLECADGHYSSEKNDSHAVCTVCHTACETCTGPSNKDCKACKDGWVKEDGSCVDHDECAAEKSPCKEDQYCSNTEGSFSCKKCDESCSGCSGEGADKCTDCTAGYVLQDDKCTDINECENSENVCTSENEDCLNTRGSYKCVCAEGFEEKDGNCVESLKTDDEEKNITTSTVKDSMDVHEDL